jgi:GMP synthase (glutamine-hydrolysing)
MNRPEETFCILSCYPKTSREKFTAADVGQPHELFARLLKNHRPSAAVETVFLADTDAPVPDEAGIDAFKGFLWTGSDLTIYDKKDPRVDRQIAFAKTLFARGAQSYGSCWALQMAAMAAGGEVQKNPKGREWGLARDVRPTAAGKKSPLLAGKPEVYDAFIMHLDEVTRLPSGADNLASNEHTQVQAAIVTQGKSRFWATQYHCEYDFHEMARLLKARSAPLVKEGFFSREADVVAYAADMTALHADPSSPVLREKLQVGDDVVAPAVREREFKNWIDQL